MSENFIIKKKCNFTQIDNSIIRSKDLSFKAKGLLEIFMSLSSEFDATLQYIADNYCKESIDTVKSAMKELRSAGYAKSEKVFNGCLLAGWRHTIYDSPQLPTAVFPLSPTAENPLSETATNPTAENPLSETATNPTAENPLSDNHYNKITNNNNNKTQQKDSPSEPSPAEEILEHYSNLSGIKTRSVRWLDMINARLKSFSKDELLKAVSATLANPFLTGDNDKNKFYATLEYIFKHDFQVDKILMRAETPKNTQQQLPLYTAEDFSKMTQDEFKALVIKTFATKHHIGDAVAAIKERGEEITRMGIWNWHLENGAV